VGQFRVHVNLWNATASSFFQDAVNDFNLSTGTTVVVLTGTFVNLSGWEAGDVVAANSLAVVENPLGSTFRTSVLSQPLTLARFRIRHVASPHAIGASVTIEDECPHRCRP